MIAALYVLPDGPYADLPDVEVWDEARDARLYAGPHPVVAHPPCQRWGRYWFGGPSARVRKKLGDDGGCFAYGHRARKATWLYFVGESTPPALIWGPSAASVRLDDGFHSAEARATAKAVRARSGAPGSIERLGKRERLVTPLPFRDALLDLARMSRRGL